MESPSVHVPIWSGATEIVNPSVLVRILFVDIDVGLLAHWRVVIVTIFVLAVGSDVITFTGMEEVVKAITSPLDGVLNETV